jgi:endonuclease/exonuclease/phosphatase family metal-dependent hydrolase
MTIRNIEILLVSIFLAGCSSIHLCGLSSSCRDPSPFTSNMPTQPNTIRVISWNLHGIPLVPSMQERLSRVAGEILQRRPHVALFQELWFDGDAALLEKMLEGGYQRVPNPDGNKKGFFDWLSGFRKSGLLAFTRRDIQASKIKFKSYSGASSAWRFWEGDGLAGKGVQSFAFELEGRPFVVMNTHLQAFYTEFSRSYLENRMHQFRELVAEVKRQPSNANIIICGDFNTTPEEFYQGAEQIVPVDWQDISKNFRATCDDRCATHLPLKNGELGLWIDYVFLRAADRDLSQGEREFGLILNRSVDCPYSDHHGLDVQIALPKRRS